MWTVLSMLMLLAGADGVSFVAELTKYDAIDSLPLGAMSIVLGPGFTARYEYNHCASIGEDPKVRMTGDTTEESFKVKLSGSQRNWIFKCEPEGDRVQQECIVKFEGGEGTWHTGTCRYQDAGIWMEVGYRFKYWSAVSAPGHTPMCPPGAHVDGPVSAVEVKGAKELSGLSGLELTKVPALFGTGTAYFADLPVPTGTVFRLRCCGTLECHFFVVHYHCPPCSRDANGKYPATLPATGWDSGSCSPSFTAGGKVHPMVSHHLRLDPDDEIDMPETETPVPYMALFAVQGAIPDPWCPRRPTSPAGPPKYVCSDMCAP